MRVRFKSEKLIIFISLHNMLNKLAMECIILYFCNKICEMISKELLKQVLTDQRNSILKREQGIRREALNQVAGKISLPHVHVITGMRRTGKSTLLRQIISKFYHDLDFYYINMEDERLISFKASEFNILYETLIELFGEQKTFFIDEIQQVAGFDVFVRRFYDDGFKFFITGSNAGLLKEEISTRLTGRHIDTLLKPFSFNEYLVFKNNNFTSFNFNSTEERAELKRYFSEYLLKGGMPEYLKYNDDEILQNIYNDILTKDIILRRNISNALYVRELYQYLISSFAQRFSFNSLLNVSPINSVNSIKKYIEALADSYFVQILNKYDHSVKKQIANDKKLYLADNGFIPLLSTRAGTDSGWLLENLVAIFLDPLSHTFYYSGRGECDFLLLKQKRFVAVIQVAFELNNANYKREIEGLAEAMKFTGLKEGMLLTFDQQDELKTEYGRIIIKPVWKWLIEGNNI